MIPFVDVSRHQGRIDWDVLAASGVPGVIIRAGNGQTKDVLVDRNMAEARRVGLLRSAYWFCNPKAATSGAGQGRLLAAAHSLYGCEMPPMWDAESYTAEAGPNPVLAGAPAARWLADMVHSVDADSGRFSLGYTGASYWNSAMCPGRFDIALGRFTDQWRADLDFLHAHDFILARYPGQHRVPPVVGRVVDNLPRGVDPQAWDDVALATGKEPPPLSGRTRTWDAWQWSAGGNAQGPVYGCQSSDLDLNICRTEAWARWTSVTPAPSPPAPIPGDDDMAVRLLKPTGTDAQFIAQCAGPKDATGVPSVAVRCEWTGDGGDPKVQRRVAAHQAAGMTDLTAITVDDLINVSLDGPLPPGMSADQFANTSEIEARMSAGTVDNVARKGVSDLNASVANLGQVLSDTKMNLARAGA